MTALEKLMEELTATSMVTKWTSPAAPNRLFLTAPVTRLEGSRHFIVYNK
jgi:hypothetical protein